MTQQQLEQSIAEIWAMFRETDRRFKETEERFKEIEERFKETAEQFKETDKRIDKRTKETDKQLKELGKQIGGLGNKIGSFTEGMAFPSMQRILTEQFKMEFVGPRIRVRKNGETIELDVLAYANSGIDEVFVVEVKSHLREDHLQEMLKNLERFPRFFPEHKDKALYGIIAVVDVPDEVKQRVLDAGLYLALIKDDTFCLDIPEGFKAKRFN
jgi:hypothetical protein